VSHILDVAGLAIGHAADAARRTGATTVVFARAAPCAVAVHGGAPGTRETELLAPENLVGGVDAVSLSGGSAFGLAAADGVMAALLSRGRGFAVGSHKVPIVPGAIVFDLSGPPADYRALGERSAAAALDALGGGPGDRAIGTIGAGTGATTARLKGGLGSAAMRVGPFTVGALVVVNAIGSPTAADAPYFRAAPFEEGAEFGGLGAPADADWRTVETKRRAEAAGNTTIGIVATDATLTKAEAKRLAVAAHDGIALSVFPAHTPFDGDLMFAAGTGAAGAPEGPHEQLLLSAAATVVVARAIARGVHAAEPWPDDRMPAWRSLYG
jgi:L-aminopeptidase/D-esterase-like protein